MSDGSWRDARGTVPMGGERPEAVIRRQRDGVGTDLIRRLVEQHDGYHGDCTNDSTWNEARALIEAAVVEGSTTPAASTCARCYEGRVNIIGRVVACPDCGGKPRRCDLFENPYRSPCSADMREENGGEAMLLVCGNHAEIAATAARMRTLTADPLSSDPR